MSLTERIDIIVDDICKDIRENPDNWCYTEDLHELKALEGHFKGMALSYKTLNIECNGQSKVFTNKQEGLLWQGLNVIVEHSKDKAKEYFINTYGGK